MLKVFVSYSHKDRELLEELNAQLATLRNVNLVEVWTDNEIVPGAEWERDIWENFGAADIILLLLSADFLASRYCYTKEFEAAWQKHGKGVTLVPILVRECDYRDGRLDKLQILCGDKAVASYGGKTTDRDPVWAGVAKKIREVVVKAGNKPKVRGRGDEEEDSEGDEVPALCNRQAQEEAFLMKFMESMATAPGAPQFYFVPGLEDAVHTSFVTRVQHHLVPKLLGGEDESLRDKTQAITAEWVQKPPTGKELAYLTTKLAWAIDGKLKPDAVQIKKHPKVAGSVVVIQHRLYAKHWNANMTALLKEYVGFWSKAADEAERPLFLVFFNVIFSEGCRPDAPEIVALTALGEELDGKPCGVAVFDPLGCVEWEHVDAWVNEYLHSRIEDTDELRQSLFANGKCLPMKEVEPALRRFLEQG